ncbi:hypothetical protein TrLO_g10458 [Triparma laevis f. longispina]|uniref:Uncharacterized protein n=1 Tax=Triparma laevis f. longispina TaxID=1714387 RepID=A0A9W7CCC8_9STRA|nr:hypothetical protein TrLO_g10458 [Triparma laevis f. longispina]
MTCVALSPSLCFLPSEVFGWLSHYSYQRCGLLIECNYIVIIYVCVTIISFGTFGVTYAHEKDHSCFGKMTSVGAISCLRRFWEVTCAVIAFCFFGVRPRDLTDDFYKALREVIEEHDDTLEYAGGKTKDELIDEIPDLFKVDDPFMSTTRIMKFVFFIIMVTGVWAGYVSACFQRKEELADEEMRNTEIIEDGGYVMGRWVILFGRFRTFLRSFVKKMKVPEDEARLSSIYTVAAVFIITSYVLFCATEIALHLRDSSGLVSVFMGKIDDAFHPSMTTLICVYVFMDMNNKWRWRASIACFIPLIIKLASSFITWQFETRHFIYIVQYTVLGTVLVKARALAVKRHSKKQLSDHITTTIPTRLVLSLPALVALTAEYVTCLARLAEFGQPVLFQTDYNICMGIKYGIVPIMYTVSAFSCMQIVFMATPGDVTIEKLMAMRELSFLQKFQFVSALALAMVATWKFGTKVFRTKFDTDSLSFYIVCGGMLQICLSEYVTRKRDARRKAEYRDTEHLIGSSLSKGVSSRFSTSKKRISLWEGGSKGAQKPMSRGISRESLTRGSENSEENRVVSQNIDFGSVVL